MPRRGTGDYDEDEATTLDPFSIHESELVVVPRPGEKMRDELRADPDVQDALRWLDPPSNAGPAAAVIEQTVPSEPMVHVPPERLPSSPPYAAQVYTPLPQPSPGPGPYPTPVPTFVPNSGAYYLVTPYPGAQPVLPAPAPAPSRSPVLWIILTAVVTGGGIALGWWLFAGRYQFGGDDRPAASTPAPAKTAPTQPPGQQTAPTQPPGQPMAPTQPPGQPTAPTAPTQPPGQPTAPTQPAGAASLTATVASLSRAGSIEVMAPSSGQVSKVFLTAPGKVVKGDKLLEIRYETGGAKAKQLAARVAELEKLAKDDPVYEDFLADARKAEKAGRGKVVTTLVKATHDGDASLVVKSGDAVSSGKPIAHIASGGDWIVKATAQGEVQRSWTCSLALPDGKKAACKIDKVIASATGSDITAIVSPKDAPWLQDVSQKPTLVLGPS